MLIAGLDEQDLDFESSHILNWLKFQESEMESWYL